MESSFKNFATVQAVLADPESSAVIMHLDDNSMDLEQGVAQAATTELTAISPRTGEHHASGRARKRFGSFSISRSNVKQEDVQEISTEIVTAFKTAQQTITIRLAAGEAAALTSLSDDLVAYATDKDKDNDTHMIVYSELIKRFNSDINTGLTREDAISRMNINGRNVLSPPKSQSAIVKLLKLFFGGFNPLLLFAGLLLILSWEPLGNNPGPPNPTNWYIGVVLFIAVFLSVLFGAYQTRKSSNIMASFRNMIPAHARALRDGEWKDILAAELQVGDIVRVEIGQKIPADVRLFEVNNLKLDNSMLTGESEPVVASVKCTSRNYLETRNLAFFGSSTVEGNGTGVVVAIGDATVMGKISSLTGNQYATQTSLQVEVNRFVKLVCIAAFTAGVLCTIGWAAWIRTSYPNYLTWQILIVTLLSLIIAFVPEGLPLAVTMTLSVVAKRMQAHNVLIKDLSTIETFNIITLVCSDKTGTLTINKMSVASLVWGFGSADSASISQHVSPPNDPQSIKAYAELLRCATLCNNAQKETQFVNSVEEIVMRGDASDTAIYTFCDKFNNVAHQQLLNQRIAFLPFNSKNKYMLSIHSVHKEPHSKLLLAKGAPEIILAMCDKLMSPDGSIRAMSTTERSLWAAQQEKLGSQGERVLGFSMLKLNVPEDTVFNVEAAMAGNEAPNFPTSGLVFLGLISLMDPPRPEVPAALEKCRNAHIRVAMVTGDHPTTAQAIAKQIGLLSYTNIDTFTIKQDALHRLNLVLLSNGAEVGTHVPSSSSSSSSFSEKADAELPVRVFTAVAAATQEASTAVETSEDNDRLVEDASSYLYTGPHSACLERGIVITGSQIALLDSMLWSWIFRHDEIVFSRTTPEQKLQIVMEAQKRGEKVAVTGDGVNDAPALRKANLGIAMQAGSEVAREAGHIILMDNNFQSIVEGLELGRLVFDNLKKVCIYLLPAGSFSEMLTVFVYLFLGVNAMLSNFQMLMICLCTDVCVSVAMVNEQAESDIMTRKPRRSDERLVDLKLLFTGYFFSGLILFFAATINFFWYCHDQGLPLEAVLPGFYWGSAYPDTNTGCTSVDGALLTSGWILANTTCFAAYPIGAGNMASGYYNVADNTTYAYPAANMSASFYSASNPNGLYYGIDTSSELPEILYVGQSIFFVSLVIAQWGNALAVRTRTQSILSHNPFWGKHANYQLPLGILIAFLFLIIFTQVPFFQNVFSTRPVPIKYALIAVVWAAAIIILDELRKYLVRNHPKSIVARVAW